MSNAHKRWQPFQALPSYAGGKRKLIPWIFHHIQGHVPKQYWRKLTFADAFVGGGSVSLWAKAQGFGRLACNDWSERSGILMQALISNSDQRFSDELLDWLLKPTSEPGHIITSLSGEIFAHRHSLVLDRIAQNVQQLSDPTDRVLGQLLLWKLSERFVGFGSTLGTSNRPLAKVVDGGAPWWELSPKRLQDQSLRKLLRPIGPLLEKEKHVINGGIFAANGSVALSQQDAMVFVEQVEADILYADPPYPGTLAYEKHYAPLDSILFGLKEDTPHSVSPFTESVEALSNFLRRAQHIPMWVVSYGNKQVDADAFKALVQSADPSRHTEVYTQAYTHMPHVAKPSNNQELLAISVDSVFTQAIQKGEKS